MTIQPLLLAVHLAVSAQAPEQPAPEQSAAAPEAQPAPATPATPTTPATPAATPPATPAESPPREKQEVSLLSLLAEVRRIKEEIGFGPLLYESHAGMGPAASKVYYSPNGLSIGGYGEFFYANRPAPGVKDESDVLRLVLYTGFKFIDRIIFNGEVEFEHGFTSKKGEVGVEFLYLDFKLHDLFSVRVGNVLVPMGFINEVHEPPFFHGVQRPELERNLLPSTWNENGVGAYGEWKGLKYRAYFLTGLQALSEQKCVVDDKGTPEATDDVKLCDTGNTGFSDSSWIRGGRQRGSKVIAETWAGVLRVDYEREKYQLGVSAYWGQTGQGQKVADQVVLGDLFLMEVHGAFRFKGLQAKAIFAYGSLSNTELISQKQGKTVGARVIGGYGELAYDILAVALPDKDMSLSPFVRLEGMNLHHAVVSSRTADPALHSVTLTAGVSFKPIGNVVTKADYQGKWNMAGTASHAISVGAGFAF